MYVKCQSQCELVPFKLKRKLSYRGHYLYDYVSPEKLTNALRWLKANNPLYADVKITDDWLDKALEDDEELVISMLQLPIDESTCVDVGDKLSKHEQPGNSADSASNLSEHELMTRTNMNYLWITRVVTVTMSMVNMSSLWTIV